MTRASGSRPGVRLVWMLLAITTSVVGGQAFSRVALGQVIDNREMAVSLARNAREVVEKRFSVDIMVARYAALFESLVEV